MSKKLTTEEFISRAKKAHGDKYDYSLVNYKNSLTKISITCPIHGEFQQRPDSHVNRKQGCPDCSKNNNIPQKGITRKWTTEEFVGYCQKIHNNNYDYSQVVYQSNTIPVKIVCPEHGQFEQLPKLHKKGHGCKRCAASEQVLRTRNSIEKNLEAFRRVHGNKYEYSLTGLENSHSKISIWCQKHGEFKSSIVNHTSNQSGCPKCASHISQAEISLYDYILTLCPDAIQNDRTVISPLELDIVIPSKKIAIEYCGLYWHTELSGKKQSSYHRNKLSKSIDNGYRLITIFENEWIDNMDVVKNRIRYILGYGTKGIGARKTEIRSNLPFKLVSDFLNRYHIQGSTTQMPIRYGAYYNDELIAVMTFSTPRIHMGRKTGFPELVRFSTDGRNHPGVASKLLKSFINEHNPLGVISYSDRRWSVGELYQNLNFEYSHTSKPNYHYVKNKKLFHRFGFQKKKLIAKYQANPELTEWQIVQTLGYDRIWDCGHDVWVLQRERKT